MTAGALVGVALPATTQAAARSVRALPGAERAVTAAAGGCAVVPYRAAGTGAARIALRGTLAGARGDWDLELLDARTGRRLDASYGLAAREVVQATVAGGRALRLQACRQDAGASRRAVVRVDELRLGAAAKAARASLVQVRLRSRTDGDRLQALGLDLGEDGSSGWLSVIARGTRDLDLIRSTGLPFRTKIPDLAAYDRVERALDAEAVASGRRSALPSGRQAYRSFPVVQQEIKDLAAAHPGRARAFTLPLKTSQGREVPGIVIADDVERAERDGRPTFPIVALHHAREWPATEIAMEFANDLLTSPDAEIRELLAKLRFVIVPVQNPDGYVSSQAGREVNPDAFGPDDLAVNLVGGVQAYRRKTCSGPLPPTAPCDLQPGADSNRNYGSNWGGKGVSSLPYEQDYRGAGPWSEPETENVHRLLQGLNATLVVSLHNVLGAVLRPPGVSDAPVPPDEDALTALGSEVAEITGYREDTFYGGLGYDGSGLTEDWAYDQLGAFTYTIEIGPSGGEFHANYQTGVVRQWEGLPDGGGGMRAGMRRMARAALDAAPHAILTGRAPAGSTIRVRKDFTTSTGLPCTAAPGITVRNALRPVACVAPGTAMALPDRYEFSMVVPAGGSFTFHVPPSVRPSLVRAGETEPFTVSCERDGTVRVTAPVVAPRGTTTPVDLAC